jgi:hypothetical protein
MKSHNKWNWEREFTDYLAVEPADVPDLISEQLLVRIHSDLNPSAISVFTKAVIIQLFVGLVTLLFCPQFGISLTSSYGIMPYLMKYGESVCMLGCGALFTSVSFFIASFVLRPEEVRALKQHEVLHLISIATLFLFALIYFGGEVALTLGLVWMLGAVVGGALTLETGWALRQSLARRVA